MAAGVLWGQGAGEGGLEQDAKLAVASLRVAAGEETIEIRLPDHDGIVGSLWEVPAEELYHPEAGWEVWRGKLNGQLIELDRFDGVRDRIFSPLFLRDENGDPVGTPVWTTEFAGKEPAFSFPRPATKKGLNSLVMLEDAVELGVGHVVENIAIGNLVDLANPNPELYQVVDGHRIGFKADAVRRLDRRLLGFREAGIDAIGILLNPKPASAHYGEDKEHSDHPVLFPPGAALDGRNVIICAFNLDTPEGIRVYRAVVEFLAERYTRPDGRYGWLSGLVIGNEIQSHWVWHNQGEAEAETVLEDYHLSLRLADIAGRSRHPGFRVFASMTHHWAARGAGDPKRGLRGDQMLEFLNERGKKAGDFPWGVAFHPYPENLFRPDFWNDRGAILSLDTPKITLKNIEVLEAFLGHERMRIDGEVREIIFSEQGFHGSPDEEGEQLQAAALAYAFEKIHRMPAVRAFHLHRHVDHPREGGLRLGLWTHAGEAEVPAKKKRAWEIYRAFGTAEWPEVSAPLLPLTGLASWEDAAPVGREEITVERKVELAEGVVIDLYHLLGKAEVNDAADFRGDVFLKSAGVLANSIFHHPPETGRSRARFHLAIPEAEDGASPLFSFGTGLSAPSTNGVIFRVYVNGERVVQHHHQEEIYSPHEVDFAPWAGQEIDLTLEVDANGASAHDWAHWVEPWILLKNAKE